MAGLLGIAAQQQESVAEGLQQQAKLELGRSELGREVKLGEQEGLGALVGIPIGQKLEQMKLQRLMRLYGLEPPQQKPATGTMDSMFGHLLQTGMEYAHRLFGTGIDRNPYVEQTGMGAE